MTLWFLLLAGFVAALVIPVFFTRSREARIRLTEMFLGLYVTAVAAVITALFIIGSFVHGAVPIGTKRRITAVLSFTEEPILAIFMLLLTLTGNACIALLGWRLFKGSRDGTLEPKLPSSQRADYKARTKK
jgi:hypothetical protein